MRKILIIIAALGLAGCGTQFGSRISDAISAVQNFSVTQGQVDAARNSYDGFVLAPMRKYALLPRCRTGQTLTLNNPCHDRKLLKKMRETDAVVSKSFDDTQAAIDTGNNSGAVAAYNSLTNAIDLAKVLINQSGVSLVGG